MSSSGDAEQKSLKIEETSTMSDAQTNNLNIALPDLQSDPSKPLNIEHNVTRTRTQSQNKAEENCKRYLDTILDVVGKDDGRRKSTNIVLIGPPGVGKSSFICSLAAAFSRARWREYAYVGSHGEEGDAITIFTDTYTKCCNEEKFKDDLLPTIIDIAGIENENNEQWKELLKIVFFGRLPEGEALITAYHYGIKHGVDGLRAKYADVQEKLKVDRVIFVCSAEEGVPTNLIKCVREAARPTGMSDDDNKRTIPLFGVMTKIDRVGKTIKYEVFEERKNKFIEQLGLKGATHRFACISNYCDDVDPQKKRLTGVIPTLDEPILQFMTQVCDPAIKVMNARHMYTGITEGEHLEGLRRRKRAEEEENKLNDRKHREATQSTWYWYIMAFIAIILIFMVVRAILKG